MKVLKFLPIAIILLIHNLYPLSSVCGYVKNINTGLPIDDATILILRKENNKIECIHTAKTDKNGFFIISYLSKGNYSFLIEMPAIGIIAYAGVGALNFYDFEIKNEQNINLNFLLGESDVPSLEKKVSKDGNKINIKILYDKSDN